MRGHVVDAQNAVIKCFLYPLITNHYCTENVSVADSSSSASKDLL